MVSAQGAAQPGQQGADLLSYFCGRTSVWFCTRLVTASWGVPQAGWGESLSAPLTTEFRTPCWPPLTRSLQDSGRRWGGSPSLRMALWRGALTAQHPA